MNAHVHGRSRADQGLTMVEVMVGVAIFTLLGALLSGFVVDMLRTSTGTTNRLANTDQLRVASDVTTKHLRIAVRPEQLNAECSHDCDSAFLVAEPDAVTFFANHGVAGEARLTNYQVEPDPAAAGTGRLVERVHPSAAPDGSVTTACGASCAERVLARGLPWPVPDSAPVFGFAASDCEVFDNAVALADIACVRIDLELLGTRENAGSRVTSTVFLPNSVMGR